MTPTELKQSASVLKALGNHERLHIITLLLIGEKNVSELNSKVKISQPSLSQHLAVLRKNDIVGSRREQRKIFYYISNPHIVRIIGILRENLAVRKVA